MPRRFISFRTWRTLWDMRRVAALHAAGLEGDPGAQPQRTVLSWQRTVLVAGVGCFALAFAAERQHRPVLAAFAGVLGAVVVVTMLVHLRAWKPGNGSTALHLVGAMVVVLAGLGTTVGVIGLIRP